eukprot:CAMPEP_0184651222 /NCGR_PEP_ID=MMETSP0308-20130426/8796_1 /TAXON_ID=38269 /ORGANISM="Gloeochaete witrockiana, Strain SAG 46.84" /LENGTH=912 /DNA_ID=CAMNT_0027085281 /DNA_START=218 /DNA_END=2956 /DNA_ORIENTATION=-
MNSGSRSGSTKPILIDVSERDRWAEVKKYRPELKYKFNSQFLALAQKSLIFQGRQYKTNCCQISFPLLMILIMFLLQLLVTSLIQSNLGKETAAVYRPALAKPFLINYDDNAKTGCPPLFPDGSDYKIDYYSGRMLYANEDPSAATLGTPGSAYACNLEVDLSRTNQAQSPVGLVGNTSQRVCDYLSYRARVDIEQGNFQSLCTRRWYNVPQWESFSNQTAIESSLFNNWDTQNSSGGFVFNKFDLTQRQFSYKILYNDTVSKGKDLPLLINLISTAIMRTLFPPPSGFRFEYPPPSTFESISKRGLFLTGARDFPKGPKTNDFDIIYLLGPFIYIFIFQLLFPVVLGGIVYEKQNRLREIMKMMGLKMGVYWLVTYIFYYLLYFVAMTLMVALAAAFNFRIFRINGFFTYFLLFFFFGHTMVSAAFFLSVFISNVVSAYVIGYVYVFMSGIIATSVISSYLSADSSVSTLSGISVVPSFALYRGLTVLQNNVAYYGPGVKNSEINDPEVRLGEVYGFLIGEAVLFLILGIYLEQVYPDGFGIKKHPLFFFQKSFWSSRRRRQAVIPKGQNLVKPGGEPDDVVAERERMLSSTDTYVRAYNLHKTYPSQRRGDKDKVAVHNLTMGVEYGECFGFLGPNGAGKTTTINMLCGYFMPTSGTALINGLDIHTSIDEIHMLMGVCPQHDLLWDKLTGREHLRFYGKLKNMKGRLLEEAITYRLSQVNLLEAGNKKTGEYSGGMKRRLSVAISLIGNPRVVLLDEPSTGLDPASRRKLWDVINDYKKDCAMLLTTHSMEEADALCDRLAIFSTGKLRCLGTAADLKRRFGSGFKLRITSPVEYEAGAHKFVMDLLPNAHFMNALAGTRNYELPRNSFSFTDVFTAFQRNKETRHITDWAISNTTLEEVFLKIAEITD